MRVDALDARVFALRNAGLPRTARIAQNVVNSVLLCPTAIRSGHLLTRYKRLDLVFFPADASARLQLCMNALIDFRARQIVGRNDQRTFRRFGILARDGRDALLMPFHFMHAALPVKAIDGRANLTTRQLLNSLLQFRVLLSHNLFESHRPHSSFLKLRERTARFDGLMLPRVAYQQNPVSRMKPFDELVHLARRGKRRLVEHIELLLTCVRLLSLRKMALQSRGLYARLGQLLCSA